jgi:branched-chain amino acid transport system ATP-binding protein
MPEPILSITALDAHYGDFQALYGLDMSLANGEVLAIIGANGAGKTTLMRSISGLMQNGAAQIAYRGQPIGAMRADQVAGLGIALVPEGRQLFPSLSVEENLLIGGRMGRKGPWSLKAVFALFPILKERRAVPSTALSGGQQQMVAIGRALMSAPTVLMLDEPSLGLWPLLCKELFSSLMQVRETGVGILLVEQNAKQSLGIADRGYLLENGSIVGEDSAESLLHDPAVQAAYLGGAAAAAVSGQVKTKSVMPAKPAVKKVASTTTTVSPEHFLPETSQRSTVSADALIDDDIGAMVARASSAAAEERVSPLSASGSVSTLNQTTSPQQTASQSASPAASAVSLPPTQDARVQQLLAEFESAARAAASGGDHTRVVDKSARHSVQDDLDNLPHIPVIRKSLVTVYRRDGSGVLRKQERR